MAFLKEAESHEPIFRAPAVLVLLIGVIVAAHLVRVLSPDWFNEQMLEHLAFIPGRYSPLNHPVLQSNFIDGAIPFVGYIFVHANATHLILNCLWLLAFGTPVARRLGWVLFLALFFVSGIVGGLAHLAGNWGSMDPAVGASGAIAGVMDAGIRLVQLSDPFGRPEGGPVLSLFDRQVLGFSIFWIVANVVSGYTGFGGLPGFTNIAWQAHVGGFLAGLLLTGPLARLLAPIPSGTDIAA